ncbi:MAG: hypothetical protein RLZZ299_2338 [Pseudomonadota bacterium]
MASSFVMPCSRCGRPVTTESGRLIATCQRCAYGVALVVDVWKGAKSASRSPAEVVAKVRGGELSGLDWIADGIAAPMPIAAHPTYRALFLPGLPLDIPGLEEEVVEEVAEEERVVRPWWILASFTTMVVAAAAAAVLWLGPRAAAAWGAILIGLRDPGLEASLDVHTIVADSVSDAPRATLLAEAWRGWGEGTPEGLVRAVERARSLAVRAPEDAEALGTLAFLLAHAGNAPLDRDAALRRAEAAAPDSPVVLLARGAIALSLGDRVQAAEHAEACLQAAPTMLPCQELAVQATAETPETLRDRMVALDTLAEAWPGNVRVRARRAQVAVALDAPDAQPLLEEVRALLPEDHTLMVADAELRFKDGDVGGARALASAAGDAANEAVAISAAETAVADDDFEAALALLAPLRASPPRETADVVRVAALEAQARLRGAETLGGAGRWEVARLAVERLRALAPSSPITAQLGMRVARGRQDARGIEVAWGWVSLAGAEPRDRSRAWATRANTLLSRGLARSAQVAALDAVRADPLDATPHVIHIAAAAAARDVPGLRAAVREALERRDGRRARRKAHGGAIVEPAPWARAVVAVERLPASGVGCRPDAEGGLGDVCVAARATLAWLQREGAAEAGVGGLVGAAIRGRAALARGDASAALAAMDEAVALEPDTYAWRLGRLEALVALARWAEADEAVRAAARTYRAVDRNGPPYDPYLEALHADVAAARGLRDEAVEAGRRALALDPLDVATRRMLRRPGIN